MASVLGTGALMSHTKLNLENKILIIIIGKLSTEPLDVCLTD